MRNSKLVTAALVSLCVTGCATRTQWQQSYHRTRAKAYEFWASPEEEDESDEIETVSLCEDDDDQSFVEELAGSFFKGAFAVVGAEVSAVTLTPFTVWSNARNDADYEALIQKGQASLEQ